MRLGLFTGIVVSLCLQGKQKPHRKAAAENPSDRWLPVHFSNYQVRSRNMVCLVLGLGQCFPPLAGTKPAFIVFR